jgi:predicted ATPase
MLVEWMKQHTPAWLVQMPTLLTPAELEEVQRKVSGASQERMLREMSEGVEAFTEQAPFILVLEDLHWSDVSTLDLLSSLARRIESARLLIMGTYRPEEGLVEGHPLRAIVQELQGHGQCQELALPLLSEAAVSTYLQQRFPTATLPSRLPEILYRNTDGSPLFLTAVVDDLLEREVITEVDGCWVLQEQVDSVATEVPVSIWQLFTRQIDRLTSNEQQIVQAASVAGLEFSSAAVAAGVGVDTTEVEECCTALVRRQHFLRPAGYSEWPDGTQAARYGFRHALYQYLWNERVPIGRRQQFHIRIGERLEKGYGSRASEIAAELAVHFERGRDYQKAVRYLEQACKNALQRSAHHEAATLLTKGLTLLKTLPDTSERAQQELALQIALGAVLIATKGYGALETEKAWTRAYVLCQQLGETSQLSPVLWGLEQLYGIRTDYRRARAYGEQMLSLAQRLQDPSLLLWAYRVLGEVSFCLGECSAAKTYSENSVVLYNPQQRRAQTFAYGEDPAMAALPYYSMSLFLLGYPDRALQKIREALTLTRELTHANSMAFASFFTIWVHAFRREYTEAREQAETVIALATEQGLPVWLALGTIAQGWVLVEQGKGEAGIAALQQGLAAYRGTGGAQLYTAWLAMLAEAYGKLGQNEDGLSSLAEALEFVDRTGECFYEAEVYRLKGELTLQTSVQSRESSVQREREAETYFLKAIEIARRQQAKSLELRATTSLARLWQPQGKKQEAHVLLSEIYGWFTEGFDTKDLQEAKALLDELAEGL